MSNESVVAGSSYLSVTPTLDTGAYASGDRFGSVMTVTPINDNGHGSTLLSLVITNKSANTTEMDVLFFSRSPAGLAADNAAFSMTAGQQDYFLGRVNVPATAHVASVGATVKNIGLGLHPESPSNSVYAIAVIRGAATYAASDLTFKFHFARDFG